MDEQISSNSFLSKFNESLSDNLLLLMKAHQVSESDLARALNLPYNTIHRLISGYTTNPRISTLNSIATYFNVSLDSLSKPNCLESKNNKHRVHKDKRIDETLLHYILQQSHHLYPIAQESNTDYADFVLGLLKEISTIDTSKENLLKIIDLAISSISLYGETRKIQNHY